MNFRENWKAAALAARIEHHWQIILRCKKRGNAWIDRGEPLNSPRLLRLNRRIDRHGLTVRSFEQYFETHYIAPRT